VTEREAFRPRHFIRDVVIATLAFAYSIWAIAGAGDDIIAKGFMLLLAGVPIYVGMRWWQQRDADRTAARLLREQPSVTAPANRELVAIGAAVAKEGSAHDA
jgi:hypothetical protein